VAVSNSSRPIRFGLIGCGTISLTHADAILGLDGAILTACCDIVPLMASDFAAKYDIGNDHVYSSLDLFLADNAIDAVTVCTPSGTHADIAARVLESGRGVIVEKPMDVDSNACDRLLAAQKAANKPLAVISQHRFDPASLRARKLIDEGRIGQVLLVEAQVKWYRTQAYYDSGDWRGTWKLDGGGCLMNQGVHTIDLMRWLAGPVKSVFAVARTAAHERIEVEDLVCATLSFASGAIGTLTASTAVFPGYPAALNLHGKKGSIMISGDAMRDIAIMGEDGSVEHDDEPDSGHAVRVAQGGTVNATDGNEQGPALGYGGAENQDGGGEDSGTPASESWEWGDAHEAQLADFVYALRSGATPAVDGTSGRQAVELVCAIYESARTGKLVNL